MKKPLFTVPLFLVMSCTDLGVELWVALEITTEKQVYLPDDTVSVTFANVGPATVFWGQPSVWMNQDRRQKGGEYRFSFALRNGEQHSEPRPTDERSSNSFLVSE
jgi:hypothetical protein